MLKSIATFVFKDSVTSHCSLDRVCHEGQSFQDKVIQLKPVEFVADIADANNGLYEAKRSNNIVVRIQQQKKFKTFAAHKCELLKIQCTNYRDDTLETGDQKIEIVDSFRYLGDEFTSNTSLFCYRSWQLTNYIFSKVGGTGQKEYNSFQTYLLKNK